MGGNSKKEKPSPRMFAKVRSVFRPKSPGPAHHHRNETSSTSPASSSGSYDQIKAIGDPTLILASPPQAHPVVAPSKDNTSQVSKAEEESAVDPPSNASQSTREQTPFIAASDPFGDRQRTEARYKLAAKKLEDALGIRGAKWRAFDLPKVTLDVSKTDPVPQLRQQIQSTLEARKNMVENPGFWERGKRIVERTFTATSPFAKVFLSIAQEGQQVLKSSLFYL